MSKKLVSAALTATTLVWAVGIAVLPVANAQTTASLQAQIQAFSPRSPNCRLRWVRRLRDHDDIFVQLSPRTSPSVRLALM